jgi:hypothetical protein
MAIRRDRNGRTHQINDAAEKPTRRIRRIDAASESADTPEREPVKQEPIKPASDTQRTYLSRGSVSPATDQGDSKEPMQDPVVGWLVIIDGPGQGRSVTLGYGRNSVGRGSGARVRLDFGDREISRDDQAVITYDLRGRHFYLQHGGGTNLTYLNDQPVLMPVEIKGGEVILIGHTRLRFVPFCGEHFDWQDID